MAVKEALLIIGIIAYILALAITIANLSVVIYNTLIEKVPETESPYKEIYSGITTVMICFTFTVIAVLVLGVLIDEPIRKVLEKMETNILEEIEELRREVIEELKEIEKKLEKKFKES